MELSSAIADSNRFLFLYGTTPPRADAAEDRIERASSRLRERVAELGLDGLVVYDVQDESDRTGEPRPFPFLPTLDSRVYSQLLQTTTGLPVICYKAVAHMDASDWEAWLDETGNEYGINCLSLVGRASSQHASSGITLPQALRVAAAHPCDFTLGGVVIPERHRPGRSETTRLLQKAQDGCTLFISQAIYSAEGIIRLLEDYQRVCQEHQTTPQRICLTFTPCGNERTLAFMKWLGISFPESAERTLLASSNPLRDSIQICTENLAKVLEVSDRHNVPLGINVESVSIRKEEITASIDLVHALRQIVRDYGL